MLGFSEAIDERNTDVWIPARNTYVGQPLEQQKDFYLLVTKFGNYFVSSANITLTNMETGIFEVESCLNKF